MEKTVKNKSFSSVRYTESNRAFGIYGSKASGKKNTIYVGTFRTGIRVLK